MEGKIHGRPAGDKKHEKEPEGTRVKLSEQTRRFAMNNLYETTGEIVITENVNNAELSMNVKNLRPEQLPYKLFIIGRRNGNSVYRVVGDIVPDCNGEAGLHEVLDPHDVDGQGSELSCFYIFMVAAAGKPLQPVLKGDLERSVKQHCSTKASLRYDYNEYYSQYIRAKILVLVQGCGRLPDISPFDVEWLTSDWKRVNDASRLPVASVGAECQVKKYGHFIFSYTEEYFYLAVPGKHSEEEWPDRGKSGFVMWQSIRGSEEYGYWCMVIDSKTGIITEIS